METNLVEVCYEGSEGVSDIKTLMRGDVLYVSLFDVQTALNKENRILNESHVSKSIIGVIRGRLKDLDEDEYIYVDNQKLTHLDNKELFVTQPGLYRVLSHDDSAAGKKFQRWLYHEVVPSIVKYGRFPPPLVHHESDIMKIAKTLVREIEEREKLERETKARFEKNESDIQAITSKIESLETSPSPYNLITITEFLEAENQQGADQHLIFGYCLKICGEENEPSRKKIEGGESIVVFPPHVIARALEMVRQR